jgi:hypothetical protein
MQTQVLYLIGSCLKCLSSMKFEVGMGVPNGNCSRICSCESLASQQLSTAENLVMLNLKGFREVRRVEPLVPNQIPTLIEIY